MLTSTAYETRAALARQELLTKVPVDERQKDHTAQWKWRRKAVAAWRVAAWPTGTDTMHDDATMCETRDVKGGAGHALLLAS